MFTTLKKIYFLDFTTHNAISHATTKYLAVNVLLFLVPLFLGESQILVGSIVNLLLIYIALNFKQAKLLPAIFLPAISSILRNTVLGSATVYLAVLLPFIWMANGIFIMAIRGLAYKWQNNFSGKKLVFTLGISAILKSLFLFSITFALVSLFKFPSVLLIAMGLLQLATASIASVIYLIFSKAKN